MKNQTKILIAIILIAILLRLWGLNFGLPYLYHPDEPNKIEMAQRMIKTGDLNPHWFLKPSLLIYLNAILYVPYYSFGKLFGIFDSINDIQAPLMLAMAVGKTEAPETVLMGRGLTVAFGVLAVFLVYLVGKRYTNENVGLLAALMMALSPTNVINSHYITVNSMLAAAILLTSLFSYWIYKKGDLRNYILAGAATGIAISMKYPGAIAGIFILFAHFLRNGKTGIKDYKIYLGIACIPIAFLIGTPYALLDFRTFASQMFSEFSHYAGGHSGMEGNAFQWYLSYTWRIEGPLNIFSLAGIIYGFINRNRRLTILASFNIVYFIFISSFQVRNDRTYLPLTPFLFIYASFALFQLKEILQEKNVKYGSILFYLLVIVFLVYQVYKTVEKCIALITPDSRETAVIWIQENIPKESRIALEPYSPFIEPTQYDVVGTGSIIGHSPEWYLENNFQYLVFGEGMYGRFYRESNKYSDQITRYDQFFDQFKLVKLFNDGDYEVKIYQVP